MPVVMDSAKMTAATISNMVFASYKNISIHFIVHHDGQITEALGLAAQEILWHPAAENALHFLNASHSGEASEISGITYAQSGSSIFGSGSRRYLAIVTINLGKQDTLERFKQTAWHQTWHIVERIEKLENEGSSDIATPPKNFGFLKLGKNDRKQPDKGKPPTGKNIVTGSQDVIAVTRSNLMADIFSCLMSGYDGDVKALQDIALMRIHNILKKQQKTAPEYYPFPIAIDATKTALEIFVSKSWPKKQIISRAVRTTKNLGLVYDDEAIKHWIVFAGNVQNMVWRGIGTNDILGAAMHMGGNTHTRILAHLISETLGIKASSAAGDTPFFNSFMPATMAENVHLHITNDLFGQYLVMALKDKKGRILNEIADKQNVALTTGEINGWCALALQYAAKAIDVAISSGHNPAELAHKEFESCRAKVPLAHLKMLSRLIIQEKRKGTTITMEKIRALCAEYDELKLIGQSIKTTVTGQEPLSERRMA